MKIAEVLAAVDECDRKLKVTPPDAANDDPRNRAAYTRHMEGQHTRLAMLWRSAFTCEDYHAMPPEHAALFERASLYAESECMRSAEDWAAQARHWEGQFRPSPTPR